MQAEVREVISAGEAQFELWRRRSGLILAPATFGLLWCVPLAVTPPAHRLAAALGAVVVLRITEAIPMAITAIGATMGASLGFMLPVSTPTNAIVYGSGRIPLTAMMRHGIVLDVVGVIAIIMMVGLLGPLVVGVAAH